MIADIAVMSVTFASVSAALAALGFFLRDLFVPREEPRQRLELAAQQPAGDLNRAFFQLVEASGTLLDMSTALMIVLGGVIAGGGICFVFVENLLAVAGGMVLGGAIPIVWLIVVRAIRVNQMRKVLPQALQAVADAVRSGQNLSETFDLVAKEIKGPLGAEFANAYSQLELGHSPIGVMSRMIYRVPLAEFRIFATAVVVHRRAGGNLSLLTERMAHAARDRHDVRNHLLAVSAGSRLSAWGMAIGSVLAVVILSSLEPEYTRSFLEHPKGPWLVGIAVSLQCVGGLWVWRILRQQY
ncbi:MAG TPA: type II secretion system F family protein [Pirellulaceae bacterium]|nr:type II secretion system F family protein [Pirellulaceae bacterium]